MTTGKTDRRPRIELHRDHAIPNFRRLPHSKTARNALLPELGLLGVIAAFSQLHKAIVPLKWTQSGHLPAVRATLVPPVAPRSSLLQAIRENQNINRLHQ